MRAPVLLICPIQPTSWKGDSANFAITEFSEVRALVLCSRAHTLASHRSMLRSLRDQLRTREGAGPLPALLLDLGPPPDQLPAARLERLAGSSAREGVWVMATKLTDTNQASTTMESQASSRMTMSRVTMFLALLAIVGIVDFLLNLAALHFLRPDVNPMLEPISNYAVGPYGFLFTAADIGLSLAALALTFGLYLSITPPGRSYVGLLLLALYGVSALLAGIFPIDVGGEATTFGTIHNIVGNISFFGFPIAVILLSLGMGKDERWRSFRRPGLALSFVVVLAVILTIVGSNLGIGYGVTQRIANVAAFVWMFAVALHLRSVAQGTLAQQPSRVR